MLVVQVAHDFTCPYCWIAYNQTVRLKQSYEVSFDWVGYELWPVGLEHPISTKAPEIPGKPRVPSRLEFAYLASDSPKPKHSNHSDDNHNALEAVEYAKELGNGEEMVAVIYEALWLRGLDINSLDVLCELSLPVIGEQNDFRSKIESKSYDDKIVKFDEPAYATGIYNVPTFVVGGKYLAEQPYLVIERAIRANLS